MTSNFGARTKQLAPPRIPTLSLARSQLAPLEPTWKVRGRIRSASGEEQMAQGIRFRFNLVGRNELRGSGRARECCAPRSRGSGRRRRGEESGPASVHAQPPPSARRERHRKLRALHPSRRQIQARGRNQVAGKQVTFFKPA